MGQAYSKSILWSWIDKSPFSKSEFLKKRYIRPISSKKELS
jgi:hypothetical protein